MSLLAACELQTSPSGSTTIDLIGGTSTPTPANAVSAASPSATIAATATSAPASATPISTAAPKPTPTPTVPTGVANRSLAGLIAFVSDRFDHAEIYLYDIDRNEVIQWTNDKDAKRNPVWAPDGRTLAYGALRDGSWQIYKKSISGGREIKLTSPPGDNYEPVWSPDGKQIAFTSNRDGREQIYVMDVEGKNVRNLTRSNFSDFQATWSPDNKMLAFASNRTGNWEIFVINADGSNPRNITQSPAGEWWPSWSPDGKRIAFASDRDGNAEVYVLTLGAGSSAVNLSRNTGADWSPSWSSDGERLSFISKRDGNFEMYAVNADGSGLRRLTTDPGDDTQPSWRWEPGTLANAQVPAVGARTSGDEGPKMVTIWHYDANPKVDGIRSSALQALGQDETAYPVPSGLVFGFEPGDLYQQIYIRDQSWMSIAAMYFYPPQYARDSVEEFLRRQYGPNTPIRPLATGTPPGDGAISGLFSPEITYDKHTTTSDEEPNLVRAAYTYWAMSGDTNWLRKDINGQTVIARLNRAMEWILSRRIDPGTSLIWRAHTTDWGDVKIEKTGSPTEWVPGDAVTASIFDQAMVYQALTNLASMNKAVGNQAEANRYLNASQDLKGQVEKYLWQPTRGFYRTHWHLTPLQHVGFDEDAIISIANALMVYTGLSDHAVVLDKLEEATQKLGAIKPGLSLYPPYPTGVFGYVQMAEGRYQNGGLWDWWGATQITAEFERGFRARATKHLAQVAEDWARHPRNIFEWQMARTGVNGGSDNYGGAVANMTEAVVRGLYGLKLEANDVSISPRLGESGGWIRAFIPSSGLFVSYRYQVAPQAILMPYETNYAQNVTFRVAMPALTRASKVTIDGSDVQFRSDIINDDVYTVFTGPTGSHAIEITYGR